MPGGSSTGCLNLSTNDVLCGGCRPAHCRLFWHPWQLPTRCNIPSCDNQNCLQILPNVQCRPTQPRLRTTGLTALFRRQGPRLAGPKVSGEVSAGTAPVRLNSPSLELLLRDPHADTDHELRGKRSSGREQSKLVQGLAGALGC